MKIIAEFILPFKMPVKDGLRQLSKYSFGELETEYLTVTKGVDIQYNNVVSSRTSLKITYFPTNGMENEDNKKKVPLILRMFVLNSIYHINKIIDGIRIAYGIQYINRISVRDLPTMINIDLDDTVYGYMTNPDIVLNQQLINSAKDFAIVGSTMTSMDMYPEAFLVDTFYESAKTALHYERFTNFIIDIQTSFEIFVRNSFRAILTKLGKSEEDIEKGNSYPFRNVIEQHLSNHLNECLNFSENEKIKMWYEKVYILRNNIVHKGLFNVSGDEANEAITAYEEARNYIADLMVREGYLSKERKIDLAIFKQNEFDEEQSNKLLKNMIDRGLVDPSLEIIKQER